MLEFFSALVNPDIPFVRYALIAGLLSSVSFGIIGSFVVVKRMSYIAGAVSHAVLGGIGIALFISANFSISVSPMFGAFVFAVTSGLIISFAVLRGNERLDTIIGAIWAIGMSIGLLFMAVTPGYVDPMSYLFGNIILIGKGDLYAIVALNVIITACAFLFYNQLLAIAFDEEFARVRGVSVSFYQVALILLISLTVLLMITIVGIVMVIALLTIPPAISGMFTKRLISMIFISIILCAIIMTVGLFVGYLFELPPSSVTILIAGATYVLSYIAVTRFKTIGGSHK